MTMQPTPSEQPAALPRKPPPPELPAAVAAEHRFHIGDLCALLESYLGASEVADVYRAYLFSAEAHEGQSRRSGEPYIFHPIEVARILALMHLDGKSISAAILHDVIEDTVHGKEQLAELFGRDVADLVDGVSKIDKIEFRTEEEAQAENFRKMLLAMSQDIRVILIKLADRLHNMRTLGSLKPLRRRAIARETLDIYAPIAKRLGMRPWALELEDLAFAHLHPMRYRVLADAIRRRQGNRKAIIEKVQAALVSQLGKEGLAAEVGGREKSLYGVYRKMQEKHLTFEQVYDVYAFRIITDKVDSCYRILGVVHNLYKPIPGRFKDYIAIPKANGYQSLHTVVFGPFGLSIEVQIRTHDMHRVAEAGVAAHWLYKSGDAVEDGSQQRALNWLRDLLAIQSEAGNANEFLDHLKVDLFPDEVYVFTPNGDIRKLPRGATVVDFAYDVHTDIGGQCVGAKVNHMLVPLRTVLRNGDHVEILTSKWGRPSPAWLDYVVTSKARAHVRHYLKNLQRDESVQLGARLMDKAFADLGIDPARLDDERKAELLRGLKLKAWNDLLADIGLGNRLASVVALQLYPAAAGASASAREAAPVLAIRGTEGVVVTYARCCRPIPGDPIIGFLSAGRGITVHTTDCPNVGKFRKRPEQWIEVNWETHIEGVFPVNVRVEVKNQRGVLAQVAAVIAEFDANIDTVNLEERDGVNSAMDFTIEVRDRVHLAAILRRLRALDSVVRIGRMKG